MGINCTCPNCRYSRGELTIREYAWYLKGCIEIASSIPKSIIDHCRSDKATKAEHDFEVNTDDEITGSKIILNEIIEDMKKAGIEVDPAFLNPQCYVLPKTSEVNNGCSDDSKGTDG